MRYVFSFITLLFLTFKSSAAPPPPALLPDQFPIEIDSYDVSSIYQNYTLFIEDHYPSVLKTKADRVKASALGPRLTIFSDWRRDSTIFQFVHRCADKCVWSLQRYTIEPNYFEELAEQEFEPINFVAEIKEMKIPPGNEWKFQFSSNPKIKQLLSEKVLVSEISQNECPEVSKGLNVLEKFKIPRLDIENVGDDDRGDVLIAHHDWFEIETNVLEKESYTMGNIKLSGYGTTSYAGALATKVFSEATYCFQG